ncbi:hypothetical protein R6258_06390 [Halomonas sp. HP20-15]|uniref:hypothetical protein n=1 Tax=Halomonas sp. HP20-15 TaxID=3085901 RepID=UPI002981B193|nr:hypothetical protein [Halomonas sp. HP20-15]MDW5376545.1 hypothetical protein [Halomonas sp. HP20-15]
MDKQQSTTETAHPHSGIGMIYKTGHTIATARRQDDEGPLSVEQAANARREAEYVARRNGVKEPLLQLWKVMH